MAMPATMKGKGRLSDAKRCVLGVDGCRAGWAVVSINLYDNSVSGWIVPSFTEVLNLEKAAMMIVDMPIGLSDDSPRACETMARKLLSPLRHASVFSSPKRPMLSFTQYEEANAWGKRHCGKGLSKQAWMIAPKIREIDEVITAADQARLGEGHPEIAFTRLNDAKPCTYPKRKPEGQAERRALLTRAGLSQAEDIYQSLRTGHGDKAIGRDDVYDAAALALTAKARLEGKALRLGDEARDARGLVMEIWG
ncbi:DUF429 domain-containing protein [Hyphococcus sp.]|uniref:DUF429 domain-containing protein n=1 Tax=Hyphococcus sp. TaxID=2038636 RepID=UPI0035C6D35E